MGVHMVLQHSEPEDYASTSEQNAYLSEKSAAKQKLAEGR